MSTNQTLNRRKAQYSAGYYSTPRRRGGQRFLTFSIIAIATAVLVVILLINIFNKNIIIKPGVLSLDDSLFDSEKAFLTNAFASKTLKNDVHISVKTTSSAPNPASLPDFHQIVYNAYVPVSGFNNAGNNLSFDEVSHLNIIHNLSDIPADDQNFYLVSLQDINASVRAASVDGYYYFDNFLKKSNKTGSLSEYHGALFRIFEIDSNDPAEAYSIISSAMPGEPTDASVLSINQTGVTALTRQMQNKLNSVGNGSYFAEKIADFLSSTDITHTSNEVSFADNCTNTVAMAFCADLRMFGALDAIGLDVVELTGNHNNDWGTDANISTIDFYHEKNIKTFGGGKTESDAAVPLEIDADENRVTWLAVNLSTSTKANGQGAAGEHPGANIYDEERVKSQISEAKARGDFVIVDVQYFECYSYPEEGEEMPACDAPISGQEAFFKSLVDMGADMVVGTQAHQPQTFELYQGKPIYYGLGNLFFDQIYWPGTRRSLVLTHFFYENKLLQTKITPTIYDNNFQTEVMNESEAKAYLSRLSQ